MVMIGPRVTDKANGEKQIYCTCCTRRLKGKFAWLEYDQDKTRYTDSGMVENSQGWFPFGMTCAKKLIAKI
jgi:hypothetical protein